MRRDLFEMRKGLSDPGLDTPTASSGIALDSHTLERQEKLQAQRLDINVAFGAKVLFVFCATMVCGKVAGTTKLGGDLLGVTSLCGPGCILYHLTAIAFLLLTSVVFLLLSSWPMPSVYLVALVLWSCFRVFDDLPDCVQRCGSFTFQAADDICRGDEDSSECQECNAQGFVYMQKMMVWILCMPWVVPKFRMMRFTWGWILLAYFGSALWVWRVSSNGLRLLASLMFLCCVNVMAVLKKWYIEKEQLVLDGLALQQDLAGEKLYRLLQIMVPSFVIIPMLKGEVIARKVDRASILFISLVDPEPRVGGRPRLKPERMLAVLDRIFTRFDEICAAHDVLKIETVGEEYMCAVGVAPHHVEDDQEGHEYNLAKLLRMAVEVHTLQLEPGGARAAPLLKMGIHTGPVVAGVVGQKLPRFRLFGDTVNTAARMMQKGIPDEVQFGQETRQHLPSWAQAQRRGEIEMKGKGFVETYLLKFESTPAPLSAWRSVGATASQRSGSRREDTNRTLPTLLGAVEDVKGDSDTRCIPRGHFRTRHGKSPSPALRPFGGSEEYGRVLEHMRSGSFTALDHQASRKRPVMRCSVRARWSGFNETTESAFQSWFHKEHVCRKMKSRLSTQMWFTILLTSLELIFLVFDLGGFAGMVKLKKAMRRLLIYLVARTVIIMTLMFWSCCVRRSEWVYEEVRRAQFCILLTSCMILALLYVSYDAIPSSCHEISTAHWCNHDDPTNHYHVAEILGLVCLPMVYLAMTAYRLTWRYSLVYVLVAIVLMVYESLTRDTRYGRGLAFSTLGIALFVLVSVLHAIESYNSEASLRARFKATMALDRTSEKIVNILATLLPRGVLEELRNSPPNAAPPCHRYFSATILQCDLCNFTRLASAREAEEVVKLISGIFAMFDDLTDRYNIYKVETIGDAYIAGQAELPLTYRNSPFSVLLLALEMVGVVMQVKVETGEEISCRIGVHTGPCVGGIVGADMQRYHLVGESMIQLEVLESTAQSGTIQVSSACKEAVFQQSVEEHIELDRLEFNQRKEAVLTTSKGEVHHYSEVNGPTYVVDRCASTSRRRGRELTAASSPTALLRAFSGIQANLSYFDRELERGSMPRQLRDRGEQGNLMVSWQGSRSHSPHVGATWSL